MEIVDSEFYQCGTDKEEWSWTVSASPQLPGSVLSGCQEPLGERTGLGRKNELVPSASDDDELP